MAGGSEGNQRISGDFWGAFFLKFRGLAVARMLFGRPFQCFFPFLCFSVFWYQSPQEKWTPPFSTNSFFSIFSRLLFAELHTRNPHRHFLGFRVEGARMLFPRFFKCFFNFSVFSCFFVQIATGKMDPPFSTNSSFSIFFSRLLFAKLHTRNPHRNQATHRHPPTDSLGTCFLNFLFAACKVEKKV